MRPKSKSVHRLVIVSHGINYRHGGRLWAYGAYAREIDIWADLFPEVVIAAPLREEPPPGDALAFTRPNIAAYPLPEFGGKGGLAKAGALLRLPWLFWRLLFALRGANAIHLRCPGNWSLPGVALARLFCARRVAKYAGQWPNYPGEAWTYRLQKHLLRSRWWGGPVTVYGEWPHEPPHIRPFFTSIMSADQVALARKASQQKMFPGSAAVPPASECSAGIRPAEITDMREAKECRLEACATMGPGSGRLARQGAQDAPPLTVRAPWRILSVGRLSRQKNVHILLEALSCLHRQNRTFQAVIIGDGPERKNLEKLARDLGLTESVTFAGAVAYDKVLTEYTQAHLLVLASETEGWPKAIAEGMAFGLVCIGSNRGLIPQMLAEGRGCCVEPGNVTSLAQTLDALMADPEMCQRISPSAAVWAQRHSLEGLRDALRTLMETEWGVKLLHADVGQGFQPVTEKLGDAHSPKNRDSLKGCPTAP